MIIPPPGVFLTIYYAKQSLLKGKQVFRGKITPLLIFCFMNSRSEPDILSENNTPFCHPTCLFNKVYFWLDKLFIVLEFMIFQFGFYFNIKSIEISIDKISKISYIFFYWSNQLIKLYLMVYLKLWNTQNSGP